MPVSGSASSPSPMPPAVFRRIGFVRLGHVRAAASGVTVMGLLTVTLALLGYIQYRPLWSPDTLTWLALLAFLLGALLILLTPGVASAGFVGMYGLYLALSHLGAVGAVIVSPRAFEAQPPWTWAWLYSPERPLAVALSGLAIGSFTLGATLFWRLAARARRPQPIGEAGAPGIYWVGIVLLAFAACHVPIAMISGRLPIFAAYLDYRSALDQVPLYSEMLFALATGLAFTMATGDTRQRRRALLLFLIPAVLIGITGSRGGVLWPVVTAVAVCSVRGYRPGITVAGIGAILFFVYIPVAGQVRNQGIARAELQEVSVHWTAPFVTNGFTLRPLVATIQWIDAGENLALGGTYLLPIQRIIGRLTPFVERPAYEAVPNSWEHLHARIPTQGYTVIAEAYYNFGVPGVLLILGSIGACLAFFGDRASNATSLAAAGALLAVLLNNVRNYSVFVPGQTVLVLALWAAGLALTPMMRLASAHLNPARRRLAGASALRA